MAKKIKKEIVIGSVVAFNNLEDTTWFDVLEIHGFNLIIREHGKPDHAEQVMDKCYVAQIKG